MNTNLLTRHPGQSIASAFLTAFLVFLTLGSAGATTLPATAVGALRDQVAPYGSINPGDGFFSWLHMANNVPSLAMEDRGFSEFDLTTLVGTPVTAELVYTITTTAGGTAPLAFDLYGYVGDGVVSYPTANLDFNAGTYLTSFTITSQSAGAEIHLDVLPFVFTQWLAGEDFVGVNLRAQPNANVNRFVHLGIDSVAGSMPELEVATEVPETARAGAVGGAVLLGLMAWRARSARRKRNPVSI